ncbi:EAL domain-containing protein [Qipengyuania sp. DGS5-3]|uniref:EAL domain-containing protein n=1 Tax=Qipengyuania sp. DGS5-3 TaxID=3349632 RepID=UPI0036D2FBFE
MALRDIFSRNDSSSMRPEDVPFTPVKSGDTGKRVALLDSFEAAGLGIFWSTDAAGRITYLTSQALDALDVAADDVLGKKLTDIVSLDKSIDEQRSERPLKFLLTSQSTISNTTVRVDASDKEVWWEISGKPELDANGNFRGYRGSAKDISDTREKQINAERMARFDALTGLSNRYRMEEQLAKRLKAYRALKRSCAILMLDLDRFKHVNDTLGHPAGDALLKQVAARITQIVGDKGEIGRLGGDEFLIILPDMDDRGDLGDLGQRLIQMISQPYSIDGARAIIGTSIGIAIAPYDGVETEGIMKAVDLALYAAKGGGRGRYRFYATELEDGAKMRHALEEDLRDALVKDELEMHYQPLVSAKTHKVTGFEALIRWTHPERGSVSPGLFIPVAEEIDIIKPMGEWALKRVCKEAVEWPVPLKVAVNVSAIQFAHDDFPQIVEQALVASGLDPQRLVLEITESVFVGDTERAGRMFKELKKLNVQLALDDFGTGYSSLSYLRNAPFDKIKIDQSFVRGSTEKNNNNAAIMSAIVGLAGALDMETVAEGVETKDELKLVKARGADIIQGYIFSAALPQETVMERLHEGDLEYEAKGPDKYRADRMTVYRKIGVIHEDARYKAVLRNLSKTGAMIEGLADVPLGTQFVLDLGDGQLAVCTVRRSNGSKQGVEFETPLISDGADGLCTRHRVSPYEIEAAGRPLEALGQDAFAVLMQERMGAGGNKKFLEVEVAPPRLSYGIAA